MEESRRGEPNAYFLSDLHLTSDGEPSALLLIQFLNTISSFPATIYLLGDIFDLWIANHDYFLKQFENVLEAFRRCRANGIEIHYFEGNHDLDLEPYFQNQLGFVIHQSALRTTLHGRRFLIEHGDQMDPGDRDYLFLRWLLRTRIVRFLGRHLPASIVNWIGTTASRKSRAYTTGLRRDGYEARVATTIESHVRTEFKTGEFDVSVSGHVHVLINRKIEIDGHNVVAVNLGTWLDKPSLFVVGSDSDRLLTAEAVLANLDSPDQAP